MKREAARSSEMACRMGGELVVSVGQQPPQWPCLSMLPISCLLPDRCPSQQGYLPQVEQEGDSDDATDWCWGGGGGACPLLPQLQVGVGRQQPFNNSLGQFYCQRFYRARM